MRPLSLVVALLFAVPTPAQVWLRKDRLLGTREHEMVLDSARGRVVLIRAEEIQPAIWSNDVWEWNDLGWTRRTPTPNPLPGRRGHAIAFDPTTRQVVLFGGEVAGFELDDTWTWDGDTWTQHNPSNRPPARCGHTMTWDPVRQRTVLFGGRTVACSGCLTDTWEWDGADWTQRAPANAPDEHHFATMAWDDARQRAVLFGGVASDNTPLAETWEWSGTDWTLVTPAFSPPGLPGPAYGMAYDAARQRLVLFGGERTYEWIAGTWVERFPATLPNVTNGPRLAHHPGSQTVVMAGNGTGADSWVWSGVDWMRRAGPVAPPRRAHHAMAYQFLRRRVVMFGGGITTTSTDRGDTWEWSGFQWQQRTPANSPSPRHAHKMASTGDAALLFGGQTGFTMAATFHGDTWLWTGVNWVDVAGGTSPSARSEHAMAYDEVRNVVILFGGQLDGAPLGDTWEWNGAWTKRSPATSPPGRRGHALAYDRDRQRIVLFGGDLQDGTDHIDDTWEYDGSGWAEQFPAVIPFARTGHAMAYDPVRQRTVMFGGWDVGRSLTPFDDVWEWDGANWLQSGAVPVPEERTRAVLTWDDDRDQLLLFGGAQPFGLRPAMDDTWISGQLVVAASTGYGTGCGGATGIPRLTGYGTAMLGNASHALDLKDARPSSAGAMLFAFGPGAFPLPSGCTFLVDPLTTVLSFPLATSAGGFASVAVPVPADVTLTGGAFNTQAFVVDPSVGFGLAATNGLAVALGY